jgi:hypothetical protein
MDRLSATPAHEHFAGYLGLLEADRRGKGGLHRSRDIKDFHQRYLTVAGLKTTSPFFSPVRNTDAGEVKPFNKNVAGSYAPSSLRPDGPFMAAVDVKGKGQGVTYSLMPDHANVASGSMLGGKRVQAVALAAYLFRDYGFEERNLQAVLDTFRDRFALRAQHTDESATFAALFDPSLDGFADEDLVPLAQDAA